MPNEKDPLPAFILTIPVLVILLLFTQKHHMDTKAEQERKRFVADSTKATLIDTVK